jgi:Ca2+/Na+ antiporter
MDVLKLPEEKQTSTNVNILTVFLLTVITSVAAVTTDLGMINAVGGGTLATLIVFVFPALMYRAAVDHQVPPPTSSQTREVAFAMTLMVVGLIMGAVGVAVELARRR